MSTGETSELNDSIWVCGQLPEFIEIREAGLNSFRHFETGGHAKFVIQHGEVKVNGEIETRRRRKLVAGDVVEIGGKQLVVTESLVANE